MKTEMKGNSAKKGLHIPREIVEKTSLREAKKIRVYGNESSIVLLAEEMTAWQLIKTVDMLNTVTTTLVMRLENAAKEYEAKCRRISVPEELLDMAGIPKGAPLDICAGEGELYISVLDEEDDLADALPDFLRDILSDTSPDFGVVRHLLESGEKLHE